MWDVKRVSLIKYIIGLGFILLLFPINTHAQEREYLIKSAFIEKITRFINWPSDELDSLEQITFGVITNEQDAFETIQYYFHDQLIHNKSVKVLRVENSLSMEQTNLLFITNDATKVLEDMGTQISNLNTLTITDNDPEQNGAHITLIIVNNKISFQINPKRLKKAGFYVSSKLYSYGEVIK